MNPAADQASGQQSTQLENSIAAACTAGPGRDRRQHRAAGIGYSNTATAGAEAASSHS